MIFNATDFARLRTLFDGSYAGYKPNVVEAPNGDDKLDVQKRYLHIATKYDPPPWAREYLRAAFHHTMYIAQRLNVPAAFWPDIEACALRVLEYPPGADSAEHTDFDLFTFNAYRNKQDVVGDPGNGLFIGEIGELIGLGKATPHSVPARDYEQHSIVFFALPRHDVVLPSGITVGEWLQERIARSRYDR